MTKYPVKCKKCTWKGNRQGRYQCECYDEWAHYCKPWAPGPGCPSWILWPCPRCNNDTTMDWEKYNKNWVKKYNELLSDLTLKGLKLGE